MFHPPPSLAKFLPSEVLCPSKATNDLLWPHTIDSLSYLLRYYDPEKRQMTCFIPHHHLHSVYLKYSKWLMTCFVPTLLLTYCSYLLRYSVQKREKWHALSHTSFPTETLFNGVEETERGEFLHKQPLSYWKKWIVIQSRWEVQIKWASKGSINKQKEIPKAQETTVCK